MRNTIPFALDDYIQLVDFTGRAIHDFKRGYINDDLPPILQRLNFNKESWIKSCAKPSPFKLVLGNSISIKDFALKIKKTKFHGINENKALFN